MDAGGERTTGDHCAGHAGPFPPAPGTPTLITSGARHGGRTLGIFDKRGASPDGQSSGRNGRKEGGTAHTAEQPPVDQGPLTCPRCQGSGAISRPAAEGDDEGQFPGADVLTCPRCDGTGKVS